MPKMSDAAIQALSQGTPPILTAQQIKEVQTKLAAQTVGSIPKGSFVVVPLDNQDQVDEKQRKQLIVMADGSALLATRRLGAGTKSAETPGVYVFKAYDLSTGQAHALKETNVPKDATQVPASVAHEREALTRAGQNYGEAQGGPCLNTFIDKQEHTAFLTVMALADGPNLEESLYQVVDKPLDQRKNPGDTIAGFAKTTPPMARALAICSDIAKEVRKLHEAGLIHRDLKPNNIHVSAAGKVQIIDFGEAILSQNGQPFHENAEPIKDYIVGTPQYMAREVGGQHIKGANAAYSPKSDSYALAETFAEVVFPEVNTKQMNLAYQEAGKHPAEIPELIQKDIQKILLDKLKSNTATPAERAAASLIGRMMSDNPAVRPTMDEAIIQFNAAAILHLRANPQEQGKLGDNLISNLELSKQEAVLHQFLQHPSNGQLLENNKNLRQDINRLHDALADINLNELNTDKLKNITTTLNSLQQSVDKLPETQGDQKRQLQLLIQNIQQTPSVQAQMMIDKVQQVIDKHEHKLFGSEQDKNLAARLTELQNTIKLIQSSGMLTAEKGLGTIQRKMDAIVKLYDELEKSGNSLKESSKQELTDLVASLNTNLKQLSNIGKTYSPDAPVATNVTAAPTTQAPMPQQPSVGAMNAAQESVAVQQAAGKPAMLTSFKTVRENNGGEDTLAKRAKVDKENESPNVPPLDLEKVQPAEQEIEAPRGQRPGRQ